MAADWGLTLLFRQTKVSPCIFDGEAASKSALQHRSGIYISNVEVGRDLADPHSTPAQFDYTFSAKNENSPIPTVSIGSLHERKKLHMKVHNYKILIKDLTCRAEWSVIEIYTSCMFPQLENFSYNRAGKFWKYIGLPKTHIIFDCLEKLDFWTWWYVLGRDLFHYPT